MQKYGSGVAGCVAKLLSKVSVAGAIGLLFVVTVSAQETDFFGGINRDSDGSEEIVLETEKTVQGSAKEKRPMSAQEEKRKLNEIRERIRKLNQATEEFGTMVNGNKSAANPKDKMTLAPLRLSIARALTADIIRPGLRSRKLVHAKTFQPGARIPQGSVLQFDMTFSWPLDASTSRKILLWSRSKNPRQRLSTDALFAIGYSSGEGDGLTWRKSKSSRWPAYAKITKKARFNAKNIAGNLRKHTGVLQIQTAVLKPGDYQLWIKIYRKKDKKTVETDIQRFNFTLTDTPLTVVADIPQAVPNYNPDRNVWAGEYQAFLSDWAVEPIRVETQSSGTGLSVPDSKDVGETVFDFYLRPKKKYIGRTKRFTLKVTDGLGRTASLSRKIYIADSRKFEIQVDMARAVKAGQTIRGTVKYPAGFRLKKKPRIADKRGFAWTSSNYTSFRIKVKEQGVDHKRLFGIIASGKINGLAEEQVLKWTRTYKVKSQDLIYDEARNKRRTQANNRAWREALSAVAGATGAAVSAYNNSKATDTTTPDQSYDEDNNSSNYEIVQRDQGGDDAGERTGAGNTRRSDETTNSTYELVQREQGGDPSGTRTGVGNTTGTSSGPPTNICGVDISDGQWQEPFYDGGRYYDAMPEEISAITIIKKKSDNGTRYKYKLVFYASSCILQSESTPNGKGYDIVAYYDNGGKEVEKTETYSKEWDRRGNLVEYWRYDGNGGSGQNCSNSRKDVPNCS